MAHPRGARVRADRLAIFTLLWAALVLVHQADEGRFATLGLDVLVDLAALASLLRPTSLPGLAVLAGVQIVAAAVAMPFITNHWLAVTVLDVVILVALAANGFRASDRDAVFAVLAPVGRALLTLAYAFAALAKLNHGFFDPEISCVGWLLGHMPEALRRLGVLSIDWTIAGTVAVECLTPLLLCRRATWRLGIALGGAFHLLMCLAGFYEFAALGIALYVFFLPPDAVDRMRRWRIAGSLGRATAILGRVGRSPVNVLLALSIVYLLMYLATTEQVSRLLPPLGLAGPSGRLAFFLWLPLAVVGLVAFIMVASGVPETAMTGTRGAGVVAGGVVLLVTLNGFSPYVGLKTEHSFTMFSNLRTEEGRWNHLLLPEAMRIFAFQDALVRPLESSNAFLQARADAVESLVPLHFRRIALRDPNLSVRYSQHGQERAVGRAGDDPLLGRSLPYFLRKLFLFKVVTPDARNACQH